MRRVALAAAAAALLCVAGAHAQYGGGNISVSGIALNRSTVNQSASIATGGTFQQIVPSNYGTTTQRQSLTVENNNTNMDNCWVYVGAGTPSAPTAILLLPGGSYTRYWPFVPSDAIQATCAATGDTLYVDTQ